MKLIKKIHKKEDKKFTALNTSKGHFDPAPDPLEPFPWKGFFEEAQSMGMRVNISVLSRSNFKILPEPAPISENATFGVALDDVMDRQRKKYPDSIVPNIVEQGVQYICKYGFREIGLFQTSSSDFEKIRKIRNSIDAGNGMDVQLHEHLKYIDVHTVAGLLKQYLREFPHPVIPPDVFDMLLASINRTSEEVRKAIHLLPRNSFNLLDKLFLLLSEICRNESHNDMDSFTLAESFGPVLMWRNVMMGGNDMYKTRDITCSFLINYSLIFPKVVPNARPILGGFFQQPNVLTKSASLSTLSNHSPPSSSLGSFPSPSPFHTPSPSPPSLPLSSSPSSPALPLSTSLPPSRIPLPSSSDPSRTSSEAPQANYMLELYRNMKREGGREGERGEEREGESDEEEGEERLGREEERGKKKEGEEKKRGLPSHPSTLSFFHGRNREMENVVEERKGNREEEDEEEMDRKGKGKLPVRGTGLRKSVSENFANKYKLGNQKKGGFGLFFLKKKT